MKRFSVAGFILFFISLFLSFPYAGQGAVLEGAGEDIPSFVGYVADEIVVKFHDSALEGMDRLRLPWGRTGLSRLDRLAERFGVTVIKSHFPGAKRKMFRGKRIDLAGWHKIKFAGRVDVARIVEEYLKIPEVIDAQSIGIHKVYATPNDPSFLNQWHLNQANDADLDAPEAWDLWSGSSEVIVAILDTGVRYYHRDLGGAGAVANPFNVNGNIWINQAEKNGIAGVDDDGNGFVDDVIGWDFVDNAGSFFYPVYSGEDGDNPDNDPRDFNGHGTHCAGIVAAINNNGYATSSPAGGWGDGTLQFSVNGVKIMPCRMGYSADYLRTGTEVGLVRMDWAAECFRYGADMGAKIASCSWGSSNSGGIAEAIDYFLSEGGLIFKAAGNDNNQTTDYMTARGDCDRPESYAYL